MSMALLLLCPYPAEIKFWKALAPLKRPMLLQDQVRGSLGVYTGRISCTLCFCCRRINLKRSEPWGDAPSTSTDASRPRPTYHALTSPSDIPPNAAQSLNNCSSRIILYFHKREQLALSNNGKNSLQTSRQRPNPRSNLRYSRPFIFQRCQSSQTVHITHRGVARIADCNTVKPCDRFSKPIFLLSRNRIL
jgi:hypothetical protein